MTCRRIAMVVLALLALLPVGASHAAPSPLQERFRPGALLVRLHPGVARFSLPMGQLDPVGPGLYALRVTPGQEQQLLRELARRPGVAYAQLDRQVSGQGGAFRVPRSAFRVGGAEYLLGIRNAERGTQNAELVEPDDPLYPGQWGLSNIAMPEAWSLITDASSLVVAVVDTGAKLDHPDLSSQLWTNPGELAGNGVDDDGNGYVDDLHGWHFYHIYSAGTAYPRQDADVADPNGHGTHVAGIIGAAGNNGAGVSGVAWRARLMLVRVLDQDRYGWESDVISGIYYALDQGAQVINMSLGLAGSSPALAEAVAEAERRGVLVVAAAGNDGGPLLYPAAYPSVLSVGASDQSDQRASFSAYGQQLDLLAPGVDIHSTWSGLPYSKRSGTSMAAPHVAGVAALLRAHLPESSPAAVRDCLLRTARELGPPGRDDLSGWGLLDAGAALRGCPAATYLPLILANY